MTTRWFSTVTLVAALFLGYVFFITGDQSIGIATANAKIADYLIKDAVIAETDNRGLTRLRLTATDATLSSTSNALNLSNVRVDYQPSGQPAGQQTKATSSLWRSAHWVVKSDSGARAANEDRLTLVGNVLARTQDATTLISIATQSLTLDPNKQTASNHEASSILIGQHLITGNQLQLSLPTQQLHLRNGGQIRLVANTLPADVQDGVPNSKFNAPTVFDYDEVSIREGVVHLTKVRSKTPPYIKAAEATARGDLGNNEIELHHGVEIELPLQGNLVADSAIVTIRDGHAVFAKVLSSNGQLIVFEHHPPVTKSGKATTIHGRALAIDYDVDANMLLMRDGRLSSAANGETEFDLDCPVGNYNVATGEAGCHKTDAKRPSTSVYLPKGKLPGTAAP